MARTLARAMFALSLLVSASTHAQAREVLDIDPVYQATPVWCWAAVGEMVFRYYGVRTINPAGHYQCGIVALLHPACDANCLNCVVPAGSLTTMNNMLTRYPPVAGQRTNTNARISTRTRSQSLTLAAVRAEIDAGRPIVAGISPSGYTNFSNVSEHVALIVGYEDDDLIVNDPFPFTDRFIVANPYLSGGGTSVAPGQYRIPYARFVSRLRWRETIYRIACQGSDCVSNGSGDVGQAPGPIAPALGRSCCTGAGKCGPFYNQPALPTGSGCWCATPMGPVTGAVCTP